MNKEKLKLLLVEDEPDICTSVQSFFGKRDFLVSTTGSGVEALSMIRASKPDIVLLDISLNDLNGIEVLRELRKYDKKTKVIIITGQMHNYEEIQTILKLDVSGYRNKPLVLEEVEKLVYQVVDHKLLLKITKPNKTEKQLDESSKSIVHKLSNLLGVIRNKCENFTLNLEEGIYKDKSSEELVKMSTGIMQEIQEAVDRAVEVVERIKENKKREAF